MPLDHLLANNREWARKVNERDPVFFEQLAQQQAPEYMWIGCADSRVPANELINLMPGEVFVHRNVANLIVHSDLNCLSTLQFAVDMLKVKHVIVCGHYGCGGVRAALTETRVGLADNWLRHIQDIHRAHFRKIEQMPPEIRADKLCELNVIEQVVNASRTTVVEDAWARGQAVTVHGWVYSLQNGLLQDLQVSMESRDSLIDTYHDALKRWMVV
ncbi:carbonate dehydratase [Burkholderiaceae bacterium DAT-1]|nr:carbonate dehydratase [Burkholderiaceae bacterium DAT-1]